MHPYPRKKEKNCKSRRLYGWHPIHEYLRSRPQHILQLYLLPSLRGSRIESLAHKERIPIRYETVDFFDTFTKGGVHQGIAARLLPFPYASLQEVLDQNGELLLILDGLVDPRNLGALLRTAEGAGVTGVIITESRSAPLSAIVEKTATGATAYLPICRVGNLAHSLKVIRDHQYWLVGLVQDAPRSLYEFQPTGRTALLLGGEERGLRTLTRQLCDFLVSIPMFGQLDSLNASVAGAVALYELRRHLLLRKK